MLNIITPQFQFSSNAKYPVLAIFNLQSLRMMILLICILITLRSSVLQIGFYES